ncbi:MAG: lysophospholipid acyltransferase family protein [Alphaproteobacteria bacterium]|nr:lysophospholipid acyltransferase family protein [Alphaproteobacteria bacterium]MBU1514359.1 lysophospholipid acyltransferase family protein [Alphaproteobacteria bacterium]MBU2096003.1 lysophospholipid acyltransferase family protein [Alphaproteobacteria bacterium]MBU2153101.1 lysophospholipid acyltransferase family protein [Alphaproteobacteria bacterium]MBU2308558.1 lysophospholipid acyltransferase family protein [Alphaproteobacteria bacterium]
MAALNHSYVSKIIWMLEASLFDAVSGLARLFPIDSVSGFGGWLFRVLGPLTSANRVADRNLRIAFPEAGDAEINRLLRAQWIELGRSLAEFLVLDRVVADTSRLRVDGEALLAAIAAGEGPVVFISGHFSCFELMPAAIIRAGVKCQITYRAMNNPYVDASVRKNRFRYGVRLFAPKGLEGARELMRGLQRGESVALMNDQKFNGGVAAPLFGHIAHTAPGPATFALRFGIPIQPMSVQRVGPGARFKLIVHDQIHLADTGDREADIEAGVRQINAFIEDRVRARPTEWFWVHRRWPSEEYRKS